MGESKERRDKSQPRNQHKGMGRNDSLNALNKQQDSIVNVSESQQSVDFDISQSHVDKFDLGSPYEAGPKIAYGLTQKTAVVNTS